MIGIVICVVFMIVFGCMYLYMLKPNSGRKGRMRPFEEVYIAHRGLFDNHTKAPENSLSAFRKAVNAGYGIELDVQLTKDGQLVVFHDAILDRMCDIEKKLTDCTYKELQQYTLADSEERIPLLKDVLKTVKGKVPLIIEIKPEGDFIGTARMLSSMMKSYRGLYCVESFHPGVVHWFRKHDPDVIRGQLSTNYKRDHIQVSPVVSMLLSNLLLNFYGKPDFIAYHYRYADDFSYRLCKKLYNFESVGWTFRSQKAMDENKDRFDVYIFDSFIPNK
ncbi:MAG: glycerophosphodiester phosphodiesterase family protein [Lachnospiraceae bacterium]|nr:glycerophosphodiester phosphodiesterase family protein [Lachnospiraceae bacterium]